MNESRKEKKEKKKGWMKVERKKEERVNESGKEKKEKKKGWIK